MVSFRSAKLKENQMMPLINTIATARKVVITAILAAGCRHIHLTAFSSFPTARAFDRFARQKPTQVLRQRLRAAVALLRLLPQALQADRLQVARHLRIEPRGGTGSSRSTCSSVSSGVSAWNGGRPVSSSYRIAPRP